MDRRSGGQAPSDRATRLGRATAKYLNSCEASVFRKSQFLQGPPKAQGRDPAGGYGGAVDVLRTATVASHAGEHDKVRLNRISSDSG